MASLDRVVVSPSLLENLDIHSVSLEFSLGMEEWTDTYLESIERTLSDSGIDTRSCASAFDSSLHLPIIPDIVDAGPSSSVTAYASQKKQPLPQLKQQDSQLVPHATKKKRFTTLSKEELDDLSKPCVLGVKTPTSLLHAVFFYNGKNFCLRGGEEHRSLKLSQLKRTDTGYIYTENASKSCSGGLAQLRVKNKSVQIHENKEIGDRCQCRILDLYISKLPLEAREKDLFYVRPVDRPNKKKPTFDSSVWYYSIPIGRNKLSQMVPEMCKLGEISGHKTMRPSYMKRRCQKR